MITKCTNAPSDYLTIAPDKTDEKWTVLKIEAIVIFPILFKIFLGMDIAFTKRHENNNTNNRAFGPS